jgi:hypothetical protein
VKIELSGPSKVYFHGGKRYREYLISMLEKIGIECEVPLKNLGIGSNWLGIKRTIVKSSCALIIVRAKRASS